MDLHRAVNRFATSQIEQWDSALSRWIPTECYGSLQVFDRFITEREFGQKKRIMTVGREGKLPTDVSIVRLEGSEETFMVEKFNEDVRYGKLYAYTYLLHEAPYYVTVCKIGTKTLASGAVVQDDDSEVVIESTWIDFSRFTASPSRTFEETEYTILSMTFPSDSAVDSDCYVKTANGDRYNVDEVYYSLDLISAKGKRIGT